METKAEVLKYMFTRIQEMLPVNVVKAKKNKDYFTYIVENDCSIEFYFQTTQGGYAGKNSPRPVRAKALTLYVVILT